MIVIKNTSGEVLHEIVLGDIKYLHKADDEKDYLIDHSNNEVKINMSFSKNPEKNKKAKDGLKAFFKELYS